jgi:predicted alpha/beta hydrolase family esterase
MKQQVIFINGAVPKENFASFYEYLRWQEYNPYEEKFLNWNKTLGDKLGEEYEYFRAPLSEVHFADYEGWKIMFEKMIPYMNDEIILATTSLWSSFILKYLWENDGILIPQNNKKVHIKKLFLIAAAIENTPDEQLGTFAFDLELVYSRVARWSKQIYIYHSRDDSLVPFEQSLKLNNYFPEAIFREFDSKGHFYKETELPEIIEDIKD